MTERRVSDEQLTKHAEYLERWPDDDWSGHLVADLIADLRASRESEAAMFRRLSNQEKFNIASRRELCEQSDRYKAERDEYRELWLAAGGREMTIGEEG